MKRAWHLGIFLYAGALLSPTGARAGVSGTPERAKETPRQEAAAHKAVLAMRDACTVNMMSRVYRPQPDCAPRQAAVVKMGDRAVGALRAELLQHVAAMQAAAQQPGAPAGGPRFLRRANNGSLVAALRQIGTPAAAEALLDVVTAPGVERDPWSVLMPASHALKDLTGAAIDLSPKSRSQGELSQISDAWRRWRTEQQGQPGQQEQAAPQQGAQEAQRPALL